MKIGKKGQFVCRFLKLRVFWHWNYRNWLKHLRSAVQNFVRCQNSRSKKSRYAAKNPGQKSM